MTEPIKPAPKAVASKARKPASNARKASKASKLAASHKPAVVKAVVGTALMVPNLTYRLGQRFLDWWRNR